jgi:cell division transport system permease protein
MTNTPEFQRGHIIPPEAAPLKALTVTMTIMCYLACLAIGALILINRAVDSWTSGLSREVTVQVRMLQNSNIETELAYAKTLLEATRGIVSVDVLDRSAGAKLLEPWIGSSNLDELPIPRLIRVTIDEKSPPDFTELEQNLKQNVKGSSLDTHRRWEAELTRVASALSTLSYAILALICVSTIAMVIFATRTVLDANRHVVDVLHLVGAKDGYIARQIDSRFLKTGLMAGLFGAVLGVVTFFLLGLTGNAGAGGFADASRGLLFAPAATAIWSYGALLSVPIIATLICLITSRVALIRMLRDVL